MLVDAVDTIEVAVKILGQTDAALRIWDGAVECWVPKSQLRRDPGPIQPGRACTLALPEWLARSKRLI